MYSFRKSLIALAGLSLLVAALAALLPLAGRGQETRLTAEPQPPMCGQRKFYLTKTKHDGSQALTACATGYHMASIWEIYDPSNLKYVPALGFTFADPDTGSGPPANIRGWVRTGWRAIPQTGVEGIANCNGWTSADGLGSGTNVGLKWEVNGETLNIPWGDVATSTCDRAQHVWCVQD